METHAESLEYAKSGIRCPSGRLNHRRLADLLQHQITSEALSPGDSFYSVREIAARYGVSLGMAHQGLKLLAERKFVETRARSGTVVGTAIRSSSASPQGVIYMIIGRLGTSDELMMRMTVCNGILKSLPDASVQLSLLPENEPIAFLDRLVGDREAKPDFLGAILSCCPREVKQYFIDASLPAVVQGHLDEDIELPFVDRDQRSIGYLAAAHLLERGHKRIGCLMYNQWRPGDGMLVSGVQRAMGEAQLGADALVISSVPGSNEELIRQAAKAMLIGPDRVTAVITRADGMAIECLNLIKQLKLRVPEDAAVFSAGLGDPAISDADPPITGFDSNTTEQGRLLGQALISLHRGESAGRHHVECPVKIVQRKST